MQVLTNIDYADNYMATKLNIFGWDELGSDDKETRIIEATRRIYAIQGIVIPYYEDDAIPDDLQQACCEVVCNMLSEIGDDDNPHNINKKLGITSISFGKDSVSYGNTSTTGMDNAVFSNYAQSLLNKYIRKAYPYV